MGRSTVTGVRFAPSWRPRGRRPHRRRRGPPRRDPARAVPQGADGQHVRIPERHLGAVCVFLPRDFDEAAKRAREGRSGGAPRRRGAAALARAGGRSRRARRVRAPHRAAVRTAARRHGSGQRARAHARGAADGVAHAARHAGRGARQRVGNEGRLQGAALVGRTRRLLRRSARSRVRVALRGVPSALQHEHLAAVAPRAAVQLHRAQRRDQHDHRQPRLDAGARRAGASVGQRLAELQRRGRRDARRRLSHRRSRRHDALAVGRTGDDRLRAFYDAHIPTVEPWDGPAAIVFADGDTVGAALDRSGFRPLRWCRTASGKVLAASETGVVDFGNDPVVQRGRLGPGDRLVVRFASINSSRPSSSATSAAIAPTSARS
jgi:hypothetical protein